MSVIAMTDVCIHVRTGSAHGPISRPAAPAGIGPSAEGAREARREAVERIAGRAGLDALHRVVRCPVPITWSVRWSADMGGWTAHLARPIRRWKRPSRRSERAWVNLELAAASETPLQRFVAGC
jgi:hypothetical protein